MVHPRGGGDEAISAPFSAQEKTAALRRQMTNFLPSLNPFHHRGEEMIDPLP